MIDPKEVERIQYEITLVGTLMGDCINDFINLKINRKTFDERMSGYADRIEAARRDEDKLILELNEVIAKMQNTTALGFETPAKPKKKK